jgi:uncharacterized protein (DUF1778 family)
MSIRLWQKAKAQRLERQPLPTVSTLKKASPARARPRKAQSEASISMRISHETLDLVTTAAAATGKTRTEFMLESARRHAIDVLLDQRLFILNEEQHDAFMRALDNPPPPNAKLKELMARKAPWEK